MPLRHESGIPRGTVPYPAKETTPGTDGGRRSAVGGPRVAERKAVPHAAQEVAPGTDGGRRSAVCGQGAVEGKGLDRRAFMAALSALGFGTTAFPGVLWGTVQQQEEPAITRDMLVDAEKVAGLEFTDEQRDEILQTVNGNLRSVETLHALEIPNDVPYPMVFDPVVPGTEPPSGASYVRASDRTGVRRPMGSLEQVAFWPVTDLAELVRTRQVSSLELTRMYLDRLKRHGPTLNCVVTLTEERALEQARRADAEIAEGSYRGPLHGIPWGAKDLLAVRGYRTTWGAGPYQDQVIDADATVVERLDDAGAVLVAKLTLGALAWGDNWFGGRTLNPWNQEQGSSGSSAGPASATVAGLVGFSIGSETLGSIVSPATRCGATGLRPTFGRVPRTHAMALSWSMDKLGPICRSAEDCALVLAAINGADGHDRAVYDVPFAWDARVGLRDLRLGYFQTGFEDDHRGKEFDEAVLEVLRRRGARLIPFELPDQEPVRALRIILNVEAAAAFDDLTMAGQAEDLAAPWGRVFKAARFVPAVEYVQANRVRARIMARMREAMRDVDAFVTPSYAGSVLLTTNLTGHPTVVLPSGFTDEGTPVSISFVGGLWNDAAALAAAKAYQDATEWHRRVPPGFAV